MINDQNNDPLKLEYDSLPVGPYLKIINTTSIVLTSGLIMPVPLEGKLIKFEKVDILGPLQEKAVIQQCKQGDKDMDPSDCFLADLLISENHVEIAFRLSTGATYTKKVTVEH